MTAQNKTIQTKENDGVEQMKENREKRDRSLDWMKGVVIILVFYGHFVERLAYLHANNGVFLAPLQHFRFIYSFHMPLALFNAGCAEALGAKSSTRNNNMISFLLPRSLPYFFGSVLFFSVVGFLPKGNYICYDLNTLHDFLYAFWSTLVHGIPPCNTPLWFLSFLTSVHLLYFLLTRYIASPKSRGLVAAFGFVLGYFATHNQKIFPHSNFWFLHEAPVGLGYFLFGRWVFSRRHSFHQCAAKAPFLCFSSAVVFVALVWATYDLNQQVGAVEHFPGQLVAVLMILNTHGSFVWFVFTSLSGIAAVVSLSQCVFLPVSVHLNYLNNSIVFVGKHSMAFFILHGIPYHYTFHRLADACSLQMLSSNVNLFVLSSLITIAHLILLSPMVVGLQRSIPQLLGRARCSGPLLPALIE